MNNTSISLLNGGFFDYETPERSEYSVKDIALGLSHTARFSGQTDRPYYVAQHCVLVSKMVDPQHSLAALLHDATEAFMADIPSPLKKLLPGYVELEKRAEADMCKRFGVAFPFHPSIKEADNLIFEVERRDMQPKIYEQEQHMTHKVVQGMNRIIAWDARTSYLNYLRRFEELTK